MLGMTGKKSFSDQLRDAIRDCGLTRYAIAKRSGIDQATLSRFMAAKGGLSVEGLDRIAESIGLRLVVEKRKGK
jgi:transcriptional regulator with XRE-family HTH domain